MNALHVAEIAAVVAFVALGIASVAAAMVSGERTFRRRWNMRWEAEQRALYPTAEETYEGEDAE